MPGRKPGIINLIWNRVLTLNLFHCQNRAWGLGPNYEIRKIIFFFLLNLTLGPQPLSPTHILYCRYMKWSESKSCSVMSSSLWPHGLYSPWNYPGQNTGVGSQSLLQGPSRPMDRTCVSHIAGRFYTLWATREAL